MKKLLVQNQYSRTILKLNVKLNLSNSKPTQHISKIFNKRLKQWTITNLRNLKYLIWSQKMARCWSSMTKRNIAVISWLIWTNLRYKWMNDRIFWKCMMSPLGGLILGWSALILTKLDDWWITTNRYQSSMSIANARNAKREKNEPNHSIESCLPSIQLIYNESIQWSSNLQRRTIQKLLNIRSFNDQQTRILQKCKDRSQESEPNEINWNTRRF